MSRQLVMRWLKIGTASFVAAGGLLFAIVTQQDRSLRQSVRNFQPSAPLGPDNLPSPKSFSPMVALTSAMPAITDIKTVSAAEITDEIADDDLVLGVEIDGESRAYSINIMTGPSREIFNDELAGRPIAATW